MIIKILAHKSEEASKNRGKKSLGMPTFQSLSDARAVHTFKN